MTDSGQEQQPAIKFTRRQFLKGVGITGASVALGIKGKEALAKTEEPPKEMVAIKQKAEERLRTARPNDKFSVDVVRYIDEYIASKNGNETMGRENPVWQLRVSSQEGSNFDTYIKGVVDFIRSYVNNQGMIRQSMDAQIVSEKLRFVSPEVLYAAIESLKTPIPGENAVPVFGESFVSQEVIDHWVEYETKHPEVLQNRKNEYETFVQKALEIEKKANILSAIIPEGANNRMGIMITTNGEKYNYTTVCELDPVLDAFNNPLVIPVGLVPARSDRNRVIPQ